MFITTRFNNKPLSFSSPGEIISCYAPGQVRNSFEKMESALKKGFHLAGFISYEAGYGMENKLFVDKSYDFPLIYMGCYPAPEQSSGFAGNPAGNFEITDIEPSIAYGDYAEDIKSIHDFIKIGDVYQITYCLKMKFGFKGDEKALFAALLKEHPMPYSAYIETDKYKILSLSPELFIKKDETLVYTKPMKGTWPRGNNIISDLYARFRLKYDAKNRAENLMITDLLRNDLGRIGKDVSVERLFEVTSYRTLYQMTSSIAARVNAHIPLYELFKAVFPSGSVTGAPKIRAMQVIRGLEREERKIYTGAIGYITPSRDLFFNVPIRTLLLENGRGEMGVGGGIIWDSTAQGEWAEGMLKSKFLFDHMKKQNSK